MEGDDIFRGAEGGVEGVLVTLVDQGAVFQGEGVLAGDESELFVLRHGEVGPLASFEAVLELVGHFRFSGYEEDFVATDDEGAAGAGERLAESNPAHNSSKKAESDVD